MNSFVDVLYHWIRSSSFWIGLVLPVALMTILFSIKSVKAAIDHKILRNMVYAALALLTAHVVGWTFNWITYGDFVNAHLITIPLFWAVAIQRRTLNPISSAVMVFTVMMFIDLVCATGFSLKHGNFFYYSTIGSGGNGYGDGLLIFPMVTLITVAAINYIRVKTQKEFRDSPESLELNLAFKQ